MPFDLPPIAKAAERLLVVVRPTHTLVRRRVVAHARGALAAWGQQHVVAGEVRATPAAFRGLSSIWMSYRGHFQHAASWRLRQDFYRRFPWLERFGEGHMRFSHRLEGRALTIRAHP